MTPPPQPPSVPFWCDIYQAAFSGQKIRAGNVFSNSSSAYERINNSEGKRYDTDPYAIMIYQPHVHPRDISEIPAEGRWISASIKRARFKAPQLISCACFVLAQPSTFRWEPPLRKLSRCRRLFAFFPPVHFAHLSYWNLVQEALLLSKI